LDLDNFTYNRKDRTNKTMRGWIVYFHDYVKYERRVELESENTENMWFEIFPKPKNPFYCVSYIDLLTIMCRGINISTRN